MKLKIIQTIKTNNFAPDFNTQVKTLMEKAKPELPYVVLYHNYQGNYHNDYEMSICKIVTKEHDFNFDTKDFIEFAHGRFTISNLVEAWQKAWAMEDQHTIERKYDYDLEYYTNDGKFSIFLSLNNTQK